MAGISPDYLGERPRPEAAFADAPRVAVSSIVADGLGPIADHSVDGVQENVREAH